MEQMKREAITLPEPMSPRGSYSSPGYYVIDQTGSPLSDRYDSQAQAFANLNGGAGVQYLDQPQPGHLNQPWPPELHTVVGHTEGGQMYSEADLLRAMASTNNLEEQRYLMSALEEVRRDARQVMAGANQVDFEPPNHIGEERPYHPYHSGAFGSSSATDWLAEMGASDDGMQEHMLTMGSRFFIGCHPEVKADPVEYLTQALGVARVAASQFNNIEGAVTIFMEHVANLARVDMTKIGVDQLLPWEAPPEQLPPVSTDEYSGPYSANQNTEDVNDEPSQDGQGLPGLDNGQSGRAMMGGLSVLSSHPHMSEFLFEADLPAEGPTPEELAAASGPGNLNKNPIGLTGSQDATPEPNDDGALSGSMSGNGPVVASRHQSHDEVTPRSDEEMWDHLAADHNLSEEFLRGAGADTSNPIWVHHLDHERTKPRNYLGHRHQAADDDDGGDEDGGYKYIHHRPGHKDSEGQDAPWVVTQKGTGKILSSHPSKEVAIDSFKAMMRSKHGGSLLTNSVECRCQELHGNFVLRNGQKVSSYIDRSECLLHNGSKAQSPQQTTYEEYLARLSPGGYPVTREFFSGAMAAHSPSENDPTVPEWGRRQGPKASPADRPAPFRGVTTRIAGHVERYMDWAAQNDLHPDDLTTLKSYERVPGVGRATTNKVADEYHGEGPEWRDKVREGWGNISASGYPGGNKAWEADRAWEHQDLPHQAANEDMLNPQAFERAVEDDAPALRPQPSGTYDPETAHDQSGEAAHDITGLIPQGDQAEPWSNISDFPETTVGGRQAAKPEDYGPQGLQGKDSPQSSSVWMNWDRTQTGSALSQPPVEGYMRDADNPNGEMWPFEIEPLEPGLPPQGAADVADVPTPGAGTGYPQPNVSRNARLDVWRANIATRTARS
jgi:hypothetical protein